MSDGDEHVSRSTFEEFKHLLDEKFRSMEARLTWRLMAAAFAASVAGKVFSPAVAAGIAALGAVGWAVKVFLVALLQR